MEWVWRLPLFLLLVVPDTHATHEYSCLSITNRLDNIRSDGTRDKVKNRMSKFDRLSVGIKDVFAQEDTDSYRTGWLSYGCPITVKGIVLSKVDPSTRKKMMKPLKGWLHITFPVNKVNYYDIPMTPDSFFAYLTR
jgi:hypothetical protein